MAPLASYLRLNPFFVRASVRTYYCKKLTLELPSQSLLRQGKRSDLRKNGIKPLYALSQSLLRQGKRSDHIVANDANYAVGLNPFFVRASVRTTLTDTPCTASCRLNPFFVRASVRTTSITDEWANRPTSQSLLRQGKRSDRPVSRTNALSASCVAPCAAAWCSAEPASESGPSSVGLSKSIGHHAKWMPLASRLLP